MPTPASNQPYLLDLAVVARSTGLPVTEVENWRTRGHQRFYGVESAVCHHTAGPSRGDYPSLGTVSLGRPDLKGPLCNFGLGRSGRIYVVAAGVAWHAGAVDDRDFANYHSIGIEAEATGVDGWPEVQMEAYARLCKAISVHYGIGVTMIRGHKEICAPHGRKSDPNFDMEAFRRRIVQETLEGDDIMAGWTEEKMRSVINSEIVNVLSGTEKSGGFLIEDASTRKDGKAGTGDMVNLSTLVKRNTLRIDTIVKKK